MNEEQAMKTLAKYKPSGILKRLHCDMPYIRYPCDKNMIELDGPFTADELEALAWWMRR